MSNPGKFILLTILLMGLMGGCDQIVTELKPTVRSFATLTPHGLPTLPPTPTLTPTITPLTPAIQGTPAPIPEEIIRPENIQRLVAYADWGRGLATQVRWSPSGNQFAVATTTGIYIYDKSGILNTVFRTDHAVRTLAYTLDGLMLAGGMDDGRVWVWNIASGEMVREMVMPSDIILSVALSPDGTLLAASGWKDGISVWFLDTGTQISTSDVHSAGVKSLAFTSSGQELLSWARTEPVWISASPDGKPLQNIAMRKDGQGFRPKMVRFSPDGETIMAVYNRQVSLISSASGTFLMSMFDFEGPLSDVSLSPGGEILATAERSGIRLWNSRTGILLQDLGALPSGDTRILLDFSPDGSRLLAVDSGIHIWQLGDELAPPVEIPGQFTSNYHLDSQPAPQGYQISSIQMDGSVARIDLANGKTQNYPNPALVSGSIATALNTERMAYVTPDHKIVIMDYSKDSDVQEINLPDNETYLIALSADGEHLAILSGDGQVEIRDGTSGDVQSTFSIQDNPHKAKFSPDGSLLMVQASQGLQLWQLQPTLLVETLTGYGGEFSGDGALLAVTSTDGLDQHIQIWSTDNLEEVADIKSNGYSVAISPSNKILAVAGTSIILWGIPGGEKLAEISLQDLPLYGDVFFMPGGDALVYVGLDGTLRLWAIQ